MKDQDKRSLESAFEKLVKRQATDADKKRLYEVKDALELSNNDALWLVLIALQSYDEMYRGIPRQIEAAAEAAARSSASRAKDQITKAVASLVPSVKDAVSKAAADAVEQVQLGKSLLGIWAGVVMLGAFFGLGWLFGTGTMLAVQAKVLSWRDVFAIAGYGIGIGAVATAGAVAGLFGSRDEGESPAWAKAGWWTMGLALLVLGGLWYKTLP